MMYTMYMIVTKDKYRLPLYWGESMAELAKNAGLSYNTVSRGFKRVSRDVYKRTQYETVHFSDRD